VSKAVVSFSKSNGYRIYNGKMSASKKSLRELPVFRNPLRPILNSSPCPPNPAKETITVANPFFHLRKKGAMMQKANIG
jgi:hypothetical protein